MRWLVLKKLKSCEEDDDEDEEEEDKEDALIPPSRKRDRGDSIRRSQRHNRRKRQRNSVQMSKMMLITETQRQTKFINEYAAVQERIFLLEKLAYEWWMWVFISILRSVWDDGVSYEF